MVPKLVSLKLTVNGFVPDVGLPENEARGPGGTIAVTIEAELFPGLESAAREATITKFVAYPATVPVPAMVMVARAAFSIVPRLQMTVPFIFVQDPMVLLADPKLMLEASRLVTKTSDA